MSENLLNSVEKIVNKYAELKYDKLKIIIDNLIFYSRDRALSNSIKDDLHLIHPEIHYLFS